MDWRRRRQRSIFSRMDLLTSFLVIYYPIERFLFTYVNFSIVFVTCLYLPGSFGKKETGHVTSINQSDCANTFSRIIISRYCRAIRWISRFIHSRWVIFNQAKPSWILSRREWINLIFNKNGHAIFALLYAFLTFFITWKLPS